MVSFNGKSVFGGIAIGKIAVLNKEGVTVKREHISDADAEKERFFDAVNSAKDQLTALYDKAVNEVGEVNAQIFEVHKMMLDDLDYQESVTHMIENEEINAEFAVATTSDNFSAMFEAMDDEYMQARGADIRDISDRVIKNLQGAMSSSDIMGNEPVILVAEDLAPSETVQLEKDKVLSFVTRLGSTTSHTAILARTMSIPALITVDYADDINGKMGIVDGYTGAFIVNPDEDTLTTYLKKQQEDLRKKELLLELKGKENVTSDGRRVKIYANIGSVSDVAIALQNDAGGIGLFRSEFLYLENDDFPTEEEQFRAYKTVLENMAGKNVVIRTLDLGADKQVDYFNLGNEDNPALGYRAIRICLTRPEIFKTQLRALYRASQFGNLSIMFPMITAVEEVMQVKEIVKEVKDELREQGIPFKEDVELGVMIETPAAAIITDLLAKEVDFFSIGTNDLTQYTLALDRQNPKLEPFYRPHHEALLRLIRMTVENGHKEGCWVGICGELGADTGLTETFIDMGVDELSVTPSMVLTVREKVRSI